jgi:predicted N-formylglutamate amidohydrolase
MADLLEQDEEHPALVINGGGQSPIVLVCEHASNRLPRRLGTLGLNPSDLARHIAFDIGAEGVARLLSKLLDAPLVLQRYSRLAYDCNRAPDHPSAMPVRSEVFDIPGNLALLPEAKLMRIAAIYRPFHDAVSHLLDRRAAYGAASIFITIHSFTKVYLGKTREVELGLLFDRDPRVAQLLIKSFPGIAARFNEPYCAKDGVMHTTNLHAAPRLMPHAMIEIRNDLIETQRGQQEWAQRLSVPFNQIAQNGVK